MRVEYFEAKSLFNPKVAFIFTVFGHRQLDGNPYGGEIFLRNGWDVVAFKSINDDWFQAIPLELFNLIKDISLKKNYIKKISYGSSMGDFASIAFSKLLNTDTVIAISPQYSFDESFDGRWSRQAKLIHFKYRISTETVKDNCKYFIFYDDKDPDNLQVKKLLGVMPIDSLQLVKLPYSGHPATNYLSEIGVLKDLVVKISNEDNFGEIDFFSARKSSKSYLLSLSHNLLKRGHLNASLNIINLAITLDPNQSWYYRQQSLVLDKLGQLDDEMESIGRALIIDPKCSQYLYNLSHLYNKKGLIEDAISSIETAISLDENNADYFNHLCHLFLCKGSLQEALIAINSAITLDSRQAWYHRQKSVIFDKLSDLESAISCINIAVDLSPETPQYREELHSLLSRRI